MSSLNEETTDDIGLKRVTIRGIDSDLYEQAVNIATKFGFSMGAFFSQIFRFNAQGEHFPPFIRFLTPFHHHRHHSKISILENIPTLSVSREDLVATGKSRFAFFNIENLTFEADIDSEVLLNHVVQIARCKKVVFLNDTIPKLIKYGLVRHKISYNPKNAELRDITIRNVSKFDYGEFLALSKQENLTVGEKLNLCLANIIPRLQIQSILIHLNEPEALVILYLEDLAVSKSGLEELGSRKVLFYGVEQLSFDEDIPFELFDEKVIQIVKCKNVIKPTNFPRLNWLAKHKN